MLTKQHGWCVKCAVSCAAKSAVKCAVMCAVKCAVSCAAKCAVKCIVRCAVHIVVHYNISKMPVKVIFRNINHNNDNFYFYYRLSIYNLNNHLFLYISSWISADICWAAFLVAHFSKGSCGEDVMMHCRCSALHYSKYGFNIQFQFTFVQ